jgi:hypothetical protein
LATSRRHETAEGLVAAEDGVDCDRRPLLCYSVPCTVSTQLSAVVARVAHAKRKRVALVGSDSVKITKHGIRKVKIHLTVAGRAALKRGHGKLAVSLTETTVVGPFQENKTGRLKLTEKRLKKTR